MVLRHDNSLHRHYYRTIGESDLPNGSRRSLDKLRTHIATMACEYCRRTGTLTLEPSFFDNRSEITYADGKKDDEHICYKVHVVCSGKHNDDGWPTNHDSHVHCFYLNQRGVVGISTHCLGKHRH